MWDRRILDLCRRVRENTDEDYAAGRVKVEGETIIVRNRMELGKVIDALYKSEINFHISAFWDAGIEVKLGDEMNGYLAEALVKTSEEAAEFLDREARKHFPTSLYTLEQEFGSG